MRNASVDDRGRQRQAAQLALWALLLGGCAAPPAGPAATAADASAVDAAPDAAADTATAVDVAAQLDPGAPGDAPDAATEAAPTQDATADAQADLAVEVAPDAAAEVAADVAADSAGEGAPDAAPDAPLETAAEVAAEVAPEIAPAETSPDSGPDAAKDVPPQEIIFGFDGGADAKALLPCSPALQVAPAKAKVLPLDLLQLQASGGTGQYRYTLTVNASDALVNQYTGTYLSGDVSGVTDTVTLTDLGCIGSATAALSVLSPMVVVPAGALVPPGTKVAIKPTLGSGNFKFALKANLSGATVQAVTAAGVTSGVYSAGAKAGLDVVVVTDNDTSQTAEVPITVALGAKLLPAPERWAIPLGSDVKLQWSGGSGVAKITSKAPAVTVVGTVAHAALEGKAAVTIADELTGQTVDVAIEVVAAKMPALPRTGDYFELASLAPFQLDKDAYTDLAIGLPEADVSHFNDGAVFIYRGSAAGLSTEASQTLHGAGQDERFGMAVAVGDFDKDGKPEIAIGAPLADAGSGDAGQVSIYERDDKTGMFATVAKRVLIGPFGGDQFGTALAVCDFNGDGWLDLAVGTPFGENRDIAPTLNDQGEIHVFLGHEAGFVDKAEIKLFGMLPTPTGWANTAALRTGQTLAAGDFNGDGACDLAVGALNYQQPGAANAGDGAVFLYKGIKASALTQGGLDDPPARAWAPKALTDPQSSFGRWMAMGDVTGDGKADLVVSHRNHDNILLKPIVSNAGAVRLFVGEALADDATAAMGDCMDANWSAVGPKASDGYGGGVAVGDADGNGVLDILAGHALGELAAANGKPATTGDAGVLAVYGGVKGGLPAAAPTLAWGGVVAGDRFGLFAAALAKPDGTGKPGVVVLAPSANEIGAGVGRPYFYAGAGDFAAKMSLPYGASGDRYGAAVAIVGDLDGDGVADLVAGAPNFDDPKGFEATTGDLFSFAGSATGVGAKTNFDWLDFTGHSAGDAVGYALAPAGDFDGDGKQDVAMIARNEDVPTTFSKSYVTLPAMVTCIADPAKAGSFKAASDVGAVYVVSSTAGATPVKDPRWIIYGPQASQALDSVTGGFDFDGDGFGDIAAGSLNWDQTNRTNAGGVMLARGRKQTATAGMHVLCPDMLLFGAVASDNMGRSVVGMGDINGDGCDELAVGIPLADQPGKNDQGAVAVVFGFGWACKYSAPMAVVLYANEAGAQGGYALATGDIDGDPLPDLVVGAVGHAKAGNGVGAAWVVLGSYLAKQAPQPWTDGITATLKPALLDPNATDLAVEGEVAGERAGSAVAVVPRPDGKGFAGIAVGSPVGAVGGTPFGGGVRVYRYVAGSGLQAIPALAVAGESTPGLSRLGEYLHAGVIAGMPTLAVGAPLGTPHGGIFGAPAVDIGTVYAVSLAGLLP